MNELDSPPSTPRTPTHPPSSRSQRETEVWGHVVEAIGKLTDEVLGMRAMIEPVNRRQRVAIIALSSFAGGVLTQLFLWLVQHALT